MTAFQMMLIVILDFFVFMLWWPGAVICIIAEVVIYKIKAKEEKKDNEGDI